MKLSNKLLVSHNPNAERTELKRDTHKKAITLHIFLSASIGLAHVVLCAPGQHVSFRARDACVSMHE
jgi:hypothetical protein